MKLLRQSSDFIAVFGIFLILSCGGGSGRSATRKPTLATTLVSVPEGQTTGVIAVTLMLSAAANSDVAFDYKTVSGTAVSGSDFKPTQGTILFPKGNQEATFNLEVLGDEVAENDEALHVAVSDADSGTPIDAVVTVVLENDDAPGPPEVEISGYNLGKIKLAWQELPGVEVLRVFVDPDGQSGFTQLGDDLPSTPGFITDDVDLHDDHSRNRKYMLEASNPFGCATSRMITANEAPPIGYVKGSNTEAGDDFGFAIGISADGTTIAIGAPGEDSRAVGVNGDEDSNKFICPGAVYVFHKHEDLWIQEAYLKASNTDHYDSFGRSIALSNDGSTLAVGTDLERSDATGINGDQENDNAPQSGAVYVFTRTDETWSQQAYIKASNAEASDRFGFRLSLSSDGNTLAVAAVGEDSAIVGDEHDNSLNGVGAVYVFRRIAETWSQEAYIKAPEPMNGDNLGAGVALSADGETLAMGASYRYFEGRVFVYTRTAGAWDFEASIAAPNPDLEDHFGYAISISSDGNTLAVGAFGEDSNATGIDGDQFDNSAARAGAAYVFDRTAGVWSHSAYIKAFNTDAGDYFGEVVALSVDGSHLIVGANHEWSNERGISGEGFNNDSEKQGAAYVFHNLNGTWQQAYYLKALNGDEGDRFGNAVAITADGGRFLVSAQNEDSDATGIGGDAFNDNAEGSGAVYYH